LCGLQFATGRFIGFCCADGQVDAADVFKVYRIASQAKSPCLAKVRRRFRMDGLSRKIVSIIYNFGSIALFGGLSSLDINGNPKVLPMDYARRMNLASRDWFLDAEIMIKAKALKLNVIELNVFAQMREGGRSNVRPSTCWEFAVNLMRYRFGGIRGLDVRPSAPEPNAANRKVPAATRVVD
jgi:hypothetical protein